MRIAISTFGSEGDFRPFAALGRGLLQAGHEVYLVAPETFRARADEAGVPFRASAPGWDEGTLREDMKGVIQERNPLQQARKLFSMVGTNMAPFAKQAVALMADADLIVHHQTDVIGMAAAELHRKPRVTAHLFLAMLRSESATMEGANLGRLGNRLFSSFIRWMMAKVADEGLGRILTATGLPPRRRLLQQVSESPLLNLIAVSPALAPTDPLWTGTVVQTGYWFLDLPQFEPPAALRAFVEQGEPPLVVTFGSMAGTDAQAQTRCVVETLRLTGRRAVLQAGWGLLGDGELPPFILKADYVPHDWLLPRASCVVHHGGAGTTAAVVRAGMPHVVVCHAGDQVSWGKLLWRREVAPAPIPHHKLTARRLAQAIEAALAPERRRRAEELGQRVRAEQGVARAVEAIQAAASRA